jgi:hypothetical protein
MSIKYASTPQMTYGPRQSANPWSRFPAGARPIATAPEQSAAPILVHEADGKSCWAIFHRNGWQRLAPFRDHKSGAVNWRMNGERVPHPVAWSPPQRKK